MLMRRQQGHQCSDGAAAVPVRLPLFQAWAVGMGERKGSDREPSSSWRRQQNSWRLLCAGATLLCLVAFASLNER